MRTVIGRLAGCIPMLATLAIVALGHGVPPASAQIEVRPYINARLGVQGFVDPDITPELRISRPLDAYGFSLGVDIGRHFGIDVAGDHFEGVVRRRSGESVGELGVFAAIPQLRLRFPVLGDRLVPYALAGVGFATSEFNDRKRRGVGRAIEVNNTAPAWSIGGGVEYFLNEHAALGAEARFLGLPGHDIGFDGARHTASLDSFVIGGTLRAYLADGARPWPATGSRGWSPYLGFNAGGAVLIHDRIAPGIEARAEHASIGSRASQLYGFVIGVDVTRAVAIELTGEGYEFDLRIPGVGLVTEYAFYLVTPRVRLAWPLLDGRLLPFVLAGAGVSYTETNDRKPNGLGFPLRGKDYGLAGVAGVGLEYRVVRNVGLAVESRYVISRGHELTLRDQDRSANLDALLTTFGVRVHFR